MRWRDFLNAVADPTGEKRELARLREDAGQFLGELVRAELKIERVRELAADWIAMDPYGEINFSDAAQALLAALDSTQPDTPAAGKWPPTGYLCVYGGRDCPGHPSKWMVCERKP